MGELFQQGSSSLARSRAHQSHSAITGAMGLQPLRTAVLLLGINSLMGMCFLPQTVDWQNPRLRSLLTCQFILFYFFQERVEEDEPMPWPGTLAVVHSYLAHKTGWGNLLRNNYLLIQ